MPDNKYVPVRKCIACRQVRPQSELLRIAVTKDGLAADPRRMLSGRGCYICREDACVKTAFEKNCFARSLRKRVPPEVLALLREQIEHSI